MTHISKPVCDPGGKIVQLLSRRRLLEKLSAKKVQICCREGHAPVDPPLQLLTRMAADVARRAVPTLCDQVQANAVDAVVRALSPEEVRIRGQRKATREIYCHRRMQIHQIHPPDQICIAEVSSLRKERVKGPQSVAGGVPIAANDFSLHSQTRSQRS